MIPNHFQLWNSSAKVLTENISSLKSLFKKKKLQETANADWKSKFSHLVWSFIVKLKQYQANRFKSCGHSQLEHQDVGTQLVPNLFCLESTLYIFDTPQILWLSLLLKNSSGLLPLTLVSFCPEIYFLSSLRMYIQWKLQVENYHSISSHEA